MEGGSDDPLSHYEDHPDPLVSRVLGQPYGWYGQGFEPGAVATPATGAPHYVVLLAGGLASATVDVSIYPLDTMKTRQQAPGGFLRSGGFRALFRGVVPTALGSAPGGAVFFAVYEATRAMQERGGVWPASVPHWATDAVAACSAAVASCLVRNPSSVIAQRMQDRAPPARAANEWTRHFALTAPSVRRWASTSPSAPPSLASPAPPPTGAASMLDSASPACVSCRSPSYNSLCTRASRGLSPREMRRETR